MGILPPEVSQVCNIPFLVVCEISRDVMDGRQLGLLCALQVRFESLHVLLTSGMISLVVLPGVEFGRVVQ